MSDTEFDVGIVGYGPVAATLAALLGQAGVSVIVFEKEAEPYPLPRAVHFDGEVMRVFQAVGIAERLEPLLLVNRGMRFVNVDGEVLIDWPRPQAVGPHGWHASYRFHQPDLEEALRDAVDALPVVRVRRMVEVVGLKEEGDAVTVSTRDRASGQSDQTRCRYVVGCDGARSFVREWIGAGLIDLESNAQWLVVDMRMKRSVEALSDWTVQLCDPDRPTTIAKGTGNRRRWEFMVMPGDDLATLQSPETIWRLLERWIGPADAEIERSAVYRFNAVVADCWGSEKVFIAGDAAHQTPPFLGQGLCAGIRDASNLAWKLVQAVGEPGGRHDRLLSSYETERSPHVREFVAQAVRVGEVLQLTARDGAAARDRAMTGRPEKMDTPAPRLGPGLADPDDALAGSLFGQPRTAEGPRLDDVAGSRFVLALAKPDAALAETAARHGVAVVVAEDVAALRVEGLLVRPDRYILASAPTLETVAGLLDRLP